MKEKEKPVLRPGEVMVKVKFAGICGSDMTAWHGGFKRIVNPVTLGHEFTGEIVEIYSEDDKKKFRIGQRVVVEPLLACGQCEACRKGNYNVCKKLGLLGLDRDGGFAPYVSVPSFRIHNIPDSLSFERAALCEPVAVAVHMVRRTNLKIGDSVAVLGAGPIGLLVAMVARRSGASKIVLTDVNDYRIKLSREMGFNVIDGKTGKLEDFLKIFGEEGCDVSFELAANVKTLNMALKLTKIRGSILAGGIFKNPPEISLQELTLKEQLLIGSRVYKFYDFDAAIDLLTQKSFEVEKLITRRLDVDEAIDKGFNAIKAGENVMKVLIDFSK